MVNIKNEKNICIIIKMYKLRDWVDETRLTKRLSSNERAVEYLEQHEHLIHDYYILLNENAIHIIEKRIQYGENSEIININENAINFLRNNPRYINYSRLCYREHGIEFVDELIKNNEFDKINWGGVSSNPAAMHILNNPDYYGYIDWCNILFNKNAVEFVKHNLHMVNKYWYVICEIPHLIDIIEQNINKIDWNGLSKNYNAIHILEKNMDNINVDNLRNNKNGFKLLLTLDHIFNNNIFYHKNIVFEYFDYCEKNNILFNLVRLLTLHGHTEKHLDYLKKNFGGRVNNYNCLSMNPNIFEYDYKRMRETRQSLLWYNDIKK